MPDISLLIPLSKELNITLEELLGNDNVEENIIEVAKHSIAKKKKTIKFLEIILLIILIFILFLMGRKIYIDNYYRNIKYNKDKISCVINNSKLEIKFKNYSPFTYVSNKIEDDENEYIFINIHYTYSNLKMYSKRYIKNDIYEENINSNKNVYVYYTKYSNVFSNNLDNDIKESKLICHN